MPVLHMASYLARASPPMSRAAEVSQTWTRARARLSDLAREERRSETPAPKPTQAQILAEIRAELEELRRHQRLCGAHPKRQRDQLLLEAVVQVALDATTGRICDRDYLCHRERGAGCSTERAAGHHAPTPG